MNNKLVILIFFAASLLPVSSSCQYYYSPNEASTLTLNEKNDLKFSFASGSDKQSSSNFSLQAGYSPIKHLGIRYSSYSIKNNFGDHQSLNGSIIGGAIGTYFFHSSETVSKAISKSRYSNLLLKNSVLLDVYLGYEQGGITNNYNVDRQSQLDFKKTFVEGGVHLEGGIFGFDFLLKRGVLDFSKGSVTHYIGDIVDLEDIERYDTYNFTETTVRFRMGIKYGSVYISQAKFRTKKADQIRIVDTAYHFGMILNIDDFFRKKKQDHKD